MSPAEVVAGLGSRINVIEEAYEFMLAYASQGLDSDQGATRAARPATI